MGLTGSPTRPSFLVPSIPDRSAWGRIPAW